MGEEPAVPGVGAAALIAFLTAVAWLTVVLVALGATFRAEPVPATAAGAEFSSARALEELRAIAQAPRMVGTVEHRRVREHLVQRLRRLGLEVEVQEATAVRRMSLAWADRQFAARVHNVLGRLRGREPGPALALMAHYDSVPAGPGAADDGAGVGSILETLRALQSSGSLKNDLLVLLTDGEEVGRLGAQAFLEEHPWAEDLKVVINLEARGASGPVLLFETGPSNLWLLRQFAENAPQPAGSSLAVEAYQHLPNDTDFTLFRERGLAGLNFAFIRDLPAYHGPLDTLDRLDERSLQHQGSHLLALARALGQADLTAAPSGDAVFFNVLGFFIVYPQGWVLPLTLAGALVFVAVFALGLRGGRLSLAGLRRSLGTFLLCLLAVPVAVTVVLWLVGRLDPIFHLMRFGEPYDGGLYCLGGALLAAAMATALVTRPARRESLEDVAAAGLLLWQIPLLATTFLAPGASYLFFWPALFATLGLGLVFFLPQVEPPSGRVLVVLFLGALPSVLILVPAIQALFFGLTFRLAGAVVFVEALLLILLAPQLRLMAAPRRRLPAALLALAAAGVFGYALLAPNFSEDRPRPNSLFYVMDADRQEARWVTRDDGVDSWTDQVLSEDGPRGTITSFLPTSVQVYIQAEASPLAVPGPRVVQEGDAGGATLALRVSSPRGAPVLDLEVRSEARILEAAVDGRPLGPGSFLPGGGQGEPLGGGVGLSFFGVPTEGFSLVLEMEGDDPVEVHVVDQSFGLPAAEAGPLDPRPKGMLPQLVPQTDSTFVSRAHLFQRSQVSEASDLEP